jgi:hypothetical protein
MIILYPLNMLGTRWNWSPRVHLLRGVGCRYSRIGLPSSVVAKQKKCLDCVAALSRLSDLVSMLFFAKRCRKIPKLRKRYIQYA